MLSMHLKLIYFTNLKKKFYKENHHIQKTIYFIMKTLLSVNANKIQNLLTEKNAIRRIRSR